jgi:hypothetical protein
MTVWVGYLPDNVTGATNSIRRSKQHAQWDACWCAEVRGVWRDGCAGGQGSPLDHHVDVGPG